MTIKTIGEHIVCVDCYQFAVTGDATSLDYHYGEEEAQDRLNGIEEGLARLTFNANERAVNLVADHGYMEDFSTRQCECCGEKLAGQRYKLLALADVEEEV